MDPVDKEFAKAIAAEYAAQSGKGETEEPGLDAAWAAAEAAQPEGWRLSVGQHSDGHFNAWAYLPNNNPAMSHLIDKYVDAENHPTPAAALLALRAALSESGKGETPPPRAK